LRLIPVIEKNKRTLPSILAMGRSVVYQRKREKENLERRNRSLEEGRNVRPIMGSDESLFVLKKNTRS